MAIPTQTYGITLPIMHGPQGYFNQSYSIVEQINSNLNLLLRTKKGERRMNPNFGSGLWNILFENFSDDISPLVETTIKRDINQWMPYVNINQILVDTSNTEHRDKTRIDVKILYTVPSIGIIQNQIIEVAMNTGNI